MLEESGEGSEIDLQATEALRGVISISSLVNAASIFERTSCEAKVALMGSESLR